MEGWSGYHMLTEDTVTLLSYANLKCFLFLVCISSMVANSNLVAGSSNCWNDASACRNFWNLLLLGVSNTWFKRILE